MSKPADDVTMDDAESGTGYTAPGGSIGRFVVLGLLGAGGMGFVLSAYDPVLDRKVALKLLHGSAFSAESAEGRARIAREAKAMARLSHPNVVTIYEIGTVQDRSFVAMELVEGPTLKGWLREQPRTPTQIVRMFIAAGRGLEAVHQAGLIHRDFKPDNVLVGRDERPRVSDFGLARARAGPRTVAAEPRPAPGQAGPGASTETTAIAGTPTYMSPEQMRGELIDARSDQYSFCVAMYEALYRERPFADGDTARRDPPALPPRGWRDECARLFEPVRRGLMVRPDERWPSMNALLEALSCDVYGEGSGGGRYVARRSALAREPGHEKAVLAMSPAIEALLGFEHRIPLPLTPLFAKVRHATGPGKATDTRRALGELGLGVLRYAFSVGMAMLAAAPAPPPAGVLVEKLQSTARSTAFSWCSLVRALHQELSSIDPLLARPLSFAIDPSLASRLGALLRSRAPEAQMEESVSWIASLLDRATALLSIPVCPPSEDAGGPAIVLGNRRVSLSPWLPYAPDTGRFLLPAAPAASGKPWRATVPASGERRNDLALDEAIRSLIRKNADTPREPCLKPPLVGRTEALAALKRAAREAEKGSVQVVLLLGPPGIGRTRLLEAAVEKAGFRAEHTLAARCSPERRSPFKPLRSAFEALPARGEDALGLVEDALKRALMPAVLPAVQRSHEPLEGIEDALLWAASEAPVALALDDIQWADAQTLRLLSLLAERAELGAKARLLLVLTARDEPKPFAPFRTFLGKVRGRACAAVKHLALGPLAPSETAALAQAVCPLDPALEQAVVRGSGGVPFLVLHALSAWREQGAITWRDGAWHAVDDRVLREGVPGVGDLVEDRLVSYFAPNSPRFHAALAALAAVALYGGGLGIETILRLGGEDVSVLERALEALVDARILVVSGERQEYGFAQEMLRQAVLTLVAHKPWLYRLHTRLLDVLAAGPSAEADAAFLAAGYEKLGSRDKACVWLQRAMDGAVAAGLFVEAAAFGERLAELTADPEARLDVELAVVRVLARGRQFEEAKRRLLRIDTREAVLPAAGTRARALDLKQRIRKLEVARGLSERGDDPRLIADADALGDPVLRCEARMALAGVSKGARALDLAGEAVALAESCGPAIKFAARVLRAELCHRAGPHALPQAEQDLTQALSIAVATSSIWQQIHVEGDLAVLEGELNRAGAAIARLSRLVEQAEARGMRGQLRLLCNNLSTGLMRDGRAGEAAEAAKRTAALAAEAGDPTLYSVALSLRAYALRHTGDLDAALSIADEAEQLQREHDERRRGYTLLRRAEIKGALGRLEEAMADARGARDIGQRHGDRWFIVAATLWEKLSLARRGEASREEVAQALTEAEAAGFRRQIQTQSLMEEAAAWLRSAAGPTT